ncbi:hypothetical protein [Flavobacteriaceae bacterium 14752]|uniref:hypothetical protein n=1 Tax=Mesohalobacter salilacus TaxID=2491711 RepID=UPI000F63CED2|nr:hypothetical protein EIG84_04820 [Flavobacteriaceae bacterium 14752]
MKKILLIILLVSGSLAMMSLQEQPEITSQPELSSSLEDSKTKVCRRGSHQTAPFFKRLCSDCKIHFANWGGKGSCQK